MTTTIYTNNEQVLMGISLQDDTRPKKTIWLFTFVKIQKRLFKIANI